MEADKVAYSAGSMHLPQSTLAPVVAFHAHDAARQAARDAMQKDEPYNKDAANVRLLKERDQAVYSFWGMDQPRYDGPKIEGIILKNALRLILSKHRGVGFSDITDIDMHKKSDTPLQVQVEDEEIKAAVSEALDAVAKSAAKTNAKVDVEHQLDFVLKVGPDAKPDGVQVVVGAELQKRLIRKNFNINNEVIMFFTTNAQNLLKEYMKRSIQWYDHPNNTLLFSKLRYKSGDLEITINNFPDEPFYSLYENGKEVGSFDDWPKNWSRPA